MKFICPKCSEKLNINEHGTAVCRNGHTYDKSRFGYYNFLLSNAGGAHGDNREMIEARRTFLDTGAYLSLANKVAELAFDAARDGGVLLDVGCGEGYYTSHIMKKLSEGGKSVSTLAFDISKDACRYTAKRCSDAEVVVASAYKMPVADSSVDLAVNIFSPLAAAETLRVLRHGGRFIMAIPGENHLYGLKKLLYKTPYKNQVADTALQGFKLLRTERVAYTLTLDSAEKIKSLFMMTPYAYRTPREARERLLLERQLDTEIEFFVFLYEKV